MLDPERVSCADCLQRNNLLHESRYLEALYGT